MRVIRAVPILLGLSLTSIALAEEFDGSVPLQCTATEAHDCLPGQGTACNPMKPESDKPPVFGIDAAKKQIKSPYRTSLLAILYQTTNKESLVLQGADLQFAWSALINKKSGAMTISIADRKGAYIVFGQCKVAEAKPAT
jgi:hypothetical protein